MKDRPVESRSKTKNSIGRGIFAAISMILQITWIVLIVTFFRYNYALINLLVEIAAVVMVLHIYRKRENMAFKLPWTMLILAFPILGCTLYFLVRHSGTMSKMKKRYASIDAILLPKLPDSTERIDRVAKEDETFANMARSIQKYGGKPSGYPLWENTDVTYFSDPVDGLEAQCRELEKAEHFIFMEYHAIEDGKRFSRVHEILKRKAKEGVEVHLIYDDLGSIGFVNKTFQKQLIAEGIETRIFNPVIPIFQIFQNNRDHRKITVIDGVTGFTGGYNLADEYFHYKEPYGYWKDSGVMLKGDAVASLTMMFVEMWNGIHPTQDLNIGRFFPKITYKAKEKSFVQPYADTPLDGVPVGENVYMNVLNAAKKYIWFTTPYLIITDELGRMLTLAAQRGVDVRIVTPGIPDKKLIYNATRSYYTDLIDGGVRIFEYTPGFIHAKDCLCDDLYAVCGTVNLDFRSFYHHFEDGVLMYRTSAIDAMKKDFEDIFKVSKEVTEDYRGKHKLTPHTLWQLILRLFAPLM